MERERNISATKPGSGVGDTLTLGLDGEVRLADWETAVAGLRELVDALAAELASDQELDWVIQDLQAGSAIATIRGMGDTDALHRVIRGYESVGKSLESSDPIPFGPRISAPASRLVDLIDGHISSVRFETARRDFIVVVSGDSPGTNSDDREAKVSAAAAWGMIEGRIQTLTTRGSYRFTLYDIVFDRAVSCYLDPEYPPDEMRDVWDRLARVEGWITRHPHTARPLSVRDIRSITLVTARSDFRKARGVLEFDHREKPESSIRRLRDG